MSRTQTDLINIVDLLHRSWSTSDEYLSWFREKVWGGIQCVRFVRISTIRKRNSHPVSMLSQVMFNREKWLNSIILDPVTGLDPPGVKVRAAQGKRALRRS